MPFNKDSCLSKKMRIIVTWKTIFLSIAICSITSAQNSRGDVTTDDYVLAASGGQIYSLTILTLRYSVVPLPANTSAYAVAVNIPSRLLYWSDFNNSQIWRSNMSGTNPAKLRDGIRATELEIDSQNGNVFMVAESVGGHSILYVMDTDGIYLKTILKRSHKNGLYNIQLDLLNKYLYFIDKLIDGRTILKRVELDGSQPQNISNNVFATAIDFGPNGGLFTLRRVQETLPSCVGNYYIGQLDLNQVVANTSPSSQSVTPVFCTSSASNTTRFKVFGTTIYLFDDILRTANINGSGVRPFGPFRNVSGGMVTSLSIFSSRYYTNYLSAFRNPCLPLPCTQLCLARTFAGGDCVCQDGFHGNRCQHRNHFVTSNSAPTAGGSCSLDREISTLCNRRVNASWSAPTWTDDHTNVSDLVFTTPNITSPASLNVGTYALNYTATDSEGKVGICLFYIKVTLSDCGARPPLPNTYRFAQSPNQCVNGHLEYAITCPSSQLVKYGRFLNKTFINQCIEKSTWKYLNLYGMECQPEGISPGVSNNTNYLIVVSGNQIFKVPFSETHQTSYDTFSIPRDISPHAAVMNMRLGILYFSDISRMILWMLHVDTGNSTRLRQDIQVKDIEVDPQTNNIYMIARKKGESKDRIYVMDQDGLYLKTILKITNNQSSFSKIALDISEKYLYFIIQSSERQLGRIRFDGSGETRFNRTLQTFNVDLQRRRIIVNPSSNEIQESTLAVFAQQGIRSVSNGSIAGVSGIISSIVAYNNALYFFDGTLKTSPIQNGISNSSSFGPNGVIGRTVTSIKFFSISYYNQYIVPLSNPCQSSIASCPELCLARSRSLSDCDCRDGFTFEFNRNRCGASQKNNGSGTPSAGPTCQLDTTVSVSSCQAQANVSWVSPTWTDDNTNSSNLQLTSPSIRSPALLNTGIHTFTYTATDNDGNVGQCSFKITISQNRCGLQPFRPKNSIILQSSPKCSGGNLMYIITCPNNRLVQLGNTANRTLINTCMENGIWKYVNLYGIECVVSSTTENTTDGLQYVVSNDFVIVVGGGRIFKIPFYAPNSSVYEVVSSPSNISAYAAAANMRLMLLYFSDFFNSEVWMSNMNGTNAVKILNGKQVKQLEVDSQTGHVFMVAQNLAHHRDLIYVTTKDGLLLKTIYKSTRHTSIAQIGLDLTQKTIYFVEQNTQNRSLGYFNFDGSGASSALYSGFDVIAIDNGLNKLYKIAYTNDRISTYPLETFSPNREGSSYNITGRLDNTIRAVILRNTFYLYGKSLKRLINGSASDFGPADNVLGNITSLSFYSTLYYKEVLGRLDNPCQSSRAQSECDQLCLATTTGLYDCDCQNGFVRKKGRCVKGSHQENVPSFGTTCSPDLHFNAEFCARFANVSWTPPRLINRRIKDINLTTPNITSPAALPIGTHRLTYIATNRAGNSTNCTFAIVVTVSDCGIRPPLPKYSGLNQTSSTCIDNTLLYYINCKSNQVVQYGAFTNNTLVNRCGINGRWTYTNLYGTKCVTAGATPSSISSPATTVTLSTTQMITTTRTIGTEKTTRVTKPIFPIASTATTAFTSQKIAFTTAIYNTTAQSLHVNADKKGLSTGVIVAIALISVLLLAAIIATIAVVAKKKKESYSFPWNPSEQMGMQRFT